MPKNSSKVSNENKQGIVFRPNFVREWILGSKFLKSYSGFGINTPKIPYQFSGKTDNIRTFFGHNLVKNEFWGQNFKNLSPVSESSPLRYHLFQFLGKTDSFDFFCANFPKNVFRMKNSEN